MIDAATQFRVILALLNMTNNDLADRLDINATTISAWKTGRHEPHRDVAPRLRELCEEKGIGFLPSGMPVPRSEIEARSNNAGSSATSTAR